MINIEMNLGENPDRDEEKNRFYCNKKKKKKTVQNLRKKLCESDLWTYKDWKKQKRGKQNDIEGGEMAERRK